MPGCAFQYEVLHSACHWRRASYDPVNMKSDSDHSPNARTQGPSSRADRTDGDTDLLQRLDALTAIFDLTEWYAGPHDLQQLLDVTAKRISKVMNAKACGIRLLDEDTDEMVITAVHNLSEEYLNKGKILVHENPIDAAVLGGDAVYIEDVATDPRVRFPVHAKREGIVGGLCVPMTYRGKTVGVIRVYTDQVHIFTAAEEALLRHAGSQAAAGIIQARLIEERRQSDRHQRQLRYAAEIQRRMIPTEAPQHSHIEVGTVYAPSLDLGGDFYDFIELSEGAFGLVVADVVGKGLPAAMMMASVRSALRAYAGAGGSPSVVVGQVNEHMSRDTLTSEFATLFYGILDAEGKLTYCNAGHDPPLLLRGDRFYELDTGGLVVGVMSREVYEEGSVALLSDDVLVFYTDGVVDTIDYDGNLFGRKRLRESIWKYRETTAHELSQQILWDTRRFAGLADQNDDTTLVVLKVR